MSAPAEMYPAITGIGLGLPEQHLNNDGLIGLLDLPDGKQTSDGAIRRLVGIEARYWADIPGGETTSYLAAKAARGALDMAGLNAESLEEIFVATNSPDSPSPSVASKVHGAIGASETCGALDTNGACAGGVLTLGIAADLMVARQQSASLVIGAETLSRGMDPTKRETAIIFGDGAGAALLEMRDSAVKPVFTKITRPDADAIYGDPETGKVVMNGKQVAEHAVYVMPEAAKRVARMAGLVDPNNPDVIDWSKIDYFVPHQANLNLMKATARALGAPEEKFVASSIVTHGNTSAASIFLALNEARRQGQIEGGQRNVLFTAIGAGMVGGAGVMSLDLPK